jgi:hypothetical protein
MGKKEAGSTTMCTYNVGSYHRQIAHSTDKIFQKDASKQSQRNFLHVLCSYPESPPLIGAQSDPPFGVPCPVSDYP